MTKPLVALALLVGGVCPASADLTPNGVTLADYLPGVARYDASVPPPATVLGNEVGAWHLRPDQSVAYLERLAAVSDRVAIEEIGRSHERRPQLLLTISSPANLARLDEIQRAHRATTEPGAAPLASELPVIVWLGFSIHGNEPSGASAALLAAYHLAASKDPEVIGWLDRAVVLIDPMLNPDGLGRFAAHANEWRGKVPVSNPNHREHVEDWPPGRTNHYFFDLNRDWLPLSQPESRARVAVFQRWRPNVFADFHEMGTNSSYFFQPGVPSRQNPLTPVKNLELTRALAKFHARALDALGSAYYTEETFDDFYYGKGSTYPDVQGAVGILFEQASARGHVQDTPNGPLTFPFTIRNQLTTALSTIRGAVESRVELQAFQREFYAEALRSAGEGAYLVGDAKDPARLAVLTEIFLAHGIEVHSLAKKTEAGSRTFEPGRAVVLPLRQRQAPLLRAMFATPTRFADPVFYDVSAWTLPYAFGLPHGEVAAAAGLLGERLTAVPPTGAEVQPPKEGPPPVAYAFEWRSTFAPRAVQRLLAADLRLRVVHRSFLAETPSGRRAFERGTVLVPTGADPKRAAQIRGLLAEAAKSDGVESFALLSGLTPEGVDLGTPSSSPLTFAKPLVVIGRGVSVSEAGEAWHVLDERFGIATTLVEMRELATLDLAPFSTIVLVDGSYRDITADTAKRLESFVRAGGVLVTQKGGARWAGRELLAIKEKEEEKKPEPAAEPRPYAEFEQDSAVRQVAGSIFRAGLDLTHPLAYGFAEPQVALFRDHETLLDGVPNAYEAPVRYGAEPLLAGFVSPENLKRLGKIPAVVATRLGRGTVIRFADNPNFRGFWYGSSRLFLNAVFLGATVQSTELAAAVGAE
jgi:hypothetical protein